MSESPPIHTPAGYASANAIGYAGSAENLILVSERRPSRWRRSPLRLRPSSA